MMLLQASSPSGGLPPKRCQFFLLPFMGSLGAFFLLWVPLVLSPYGFPWCFLASMGSLGACFLLQMGFLGFDIISITADAQQNHV
jgi:hypothetical protein